MAEQQGKVSIDVLIKDAQAAKTLKELDDATAKLNKELRNTEVGSEEFAKLNRAVAGVDERMTQATNAGLSFNQQLNNTPGLVGNMSKSFSGLFNLLKTNPMVAILTLVAGLILKISQNINLTSNQTAELSRGFAQFRALIQPLLNFIADRVGDIVGLFVRLTDGAMNLARRLGLVSDEMQRQLDLANDIARSEEKLRQERNQFLIREQEINTEINKLREKANDLDLSSNERAEALGKITELINEKNQEQLRIAEEQLRIAEQISEQANDTAEDEEELAKLAANVARIRGQANAESLRFQKQIQALRKQEATEQEKRVEEQRKAIREVHELERNLLQEISDARLSSMERDIAMIDGRYQEELDQLRKFGLDTTEIEEFIEEEKQRIRDRYRQEDERKRLELAEKQFNLNRQIEEREADFAMRNIERMNEVDIEARRDTLAKQLDDETLSFEERKRLLEDFYLFQQESETEMALLRRDTMLRQAEEDINFKKEQLEKEKLLELENFAGTEEQKLLLIEDFKLREEQLEQDFIDRRNEILKNGEEEKLSIYRSTQDAVSAGIDDLVEKQRDAAQQRAEFEMMVSNVASQSFSQASNAILSIMDDQNKGTKKAATGLALIDGLLAIQSAYASLGPIGGSIAAVGIAGNTTAAISKINSTNVSPISGSSSTGGGGITPFTPDVTQTNLPDSINPNLEQQTQTNENLQGIRGDLQRPMRAYVVQNDINDSEELEKLLENKSRL